jgi:glycosyltransferase involved in cell wall biosynthesis
MRASVVVPVYNPGGSLDRCIDSLLCQSLPPASTQLIFVDDGSTDGTGARLDDLARRHPHVQVVHEPNSGWAGRPRNVGLDLAAGEFVQFVDQDDTLGPEALERLSDYGATNSADIVIGKVTSDFRRVPQELFRRNISRCSVRDAPLMRSLTPHKMFRRSFLVDKQLRFAEGRRRLEDQLFMTQAYFATDAVAVLADYPCYFYLRRDDDRNSAKSFYEPADYYAYLREVLEVVAANTEPGPFRDGVHARFLNSMLQKVALVAKPGTEERLASFMTEISAVVDEQFSPGVVRHAPVLRRQLATAIVAGKPKKVQAAVRRYGRVGFNVDKLAVRTSAAGGWTVSTAASLVFRDGSPLLFRRHGDRWRVDKRLRVPVLKVGSHTQEDLLGGANGELVARSRQSGVGWLGADQLTASLEPSRGTHGGYVMRLSGDIALDPSTFAAGGPLPSGTWQLGLRINALGTNRNVPLRRQAGMRLPRRPDRVRGAAKLRFRRGVRLVVVVKDE